MDIMVNRFSTGGRIAGAIGACVGLLALACAVLPTGSLVGLSERAEAQVAPAPAPAVAAPAVVLPQPAPPAPRQPPLVADVVQSGVLVVVSKASQRMYVFKDGEPWASSPVSTGKRGHGTPAGVFPILQKKAFHRSNLYSNAPMPFMQRLTWGGIAIHAGHLPGYPASHGCIRLPYSFAKALFALTRADTTTVVVTNAAVRTDDTALVLALGTDGPDADMPMQARPRLAAAPEPPMPGEATVAQAVPAQFAGAGQTIQLAAATSPDEAEDRWQALLARHPELAGFRKTVIPAVVGARRYYRLRVSAPGAHAYCAALRRAGQDCFNVS